VQLRAAPCSCWWWWQVLLLLLLQKHTAAHLAQTRCQAAQSLARVALLLP
jgi:hypothetical protein